MPMTGGQQTPEVFYIEPQVSITTETHALLSDHQAFGAERLMQHVERAPQVSAGMGWVSFRPESGN